jgi:alkanesulfonate monooxygenase SsuD/methylene tetrahydromethanopterin reductase-like flavin-dependent oxidoreductase (luciferase family)
MRLGIVHPAEPEATGAAPEHDPLEAARHLEELGLDALWLGPPAGGPAAPIRLAALAARTSRLRLGAALALAGHDPVRVAEDWATLDGISGGRVELGVTDPLAGEEDALALRERLELLVRLFEQEEVSWSGSFRPPLERVTVQPRPVQRPHPPAWLLCAGSERAADLAGALGLPLLLAGELPPEALAPLVGRYRERLARAGRDAVPVGLVSEVRGRSAEVARRLAALRDAHGLSLHLARLDPAEPAGAERYAREVALALRG